MIPNLNSVLKSLFYLLIIHNIVTADDQWTYNSLNSNKNWQGNWFPYAPETGADRNPVIDIRQDLYDTDHGIMMGVEDPRCDDAKTNLEIDWDFNPVNYTCLVYNRRILYRPRSDVQPLYSYDHIPKGYSAPHKCMDEPIEYSDIIPTFGTHRPLWAKYGEYTFLPRQRWIHNLEHGAVVMLYHPCADKNEVHALKKIVKKCLYRHVITPYNLLSRERPLALVTWGYRLEMSKVAPDLVINFIQRHALQGPEQTTRDGQFSVMLEHHADIVSDLNDHQICKVFDYIQ